MLTESGYDDERDEQPKRDPDLGLNRLGLILMSIGVLIALAGILIADSVP